MWGLILLIFVFEFIRDIQRDGDFMGYVNAGNAVLNGSNIYADYLNTWPPFFSLFSLPLAIGHNLSPLLIRGIWLIGIALVWYGIIRVSNLLFAQSSMVKWTSWLILLPMLFTLRFIIEDISNIQINSMLLLASLYTFYLERQGKLVWAGLLLAFIISLKVYPIFILFYFLYKRAWKMVGWTALFLVVLNGFTLLIFGLETGELYYETFVQERILGDPIFIHKNQSFIAFGIGLLSDVSRGLDIHYNITGLPISVAKNISHFLFLFLFLPVASMMRKSWSNTSNTDKNLEITLLLALIPLASPLAWKYYFVFLFPLYFLATGRWDGKVSMTVKVLIILSFVLTILTTEGVIQRHLSDVTEVYGAITWGVVLQVYLVLSNSNWESESQNESQSES